MKLKNNADNKYKNIVRTFHMKYYETSYEEYLNALDRFNMNEKSSLYKKQFPRNVEQFENLIIYGPVGSGKYSQTLYFLKQYSPSGLKYEKKMTVQNEKQNYTFHISDIHYEIDMSLLGCNSKTIWTDLFSQIVDIVSVKQKKIGIIICKNFHMIHTELLDIFYSYIQQYNSKHENIMLRFVLITEHISFMPTKLLQSCEVIPIAKPCAQVLETMIQTERNPIKSTFPQRILKRDSRINRELLSQIDTNTIINLKEISSFDLIGGVDTIPKDIFNIVCDGVISMMSNKEAFQFVEFRDALYDIFIYNLDIIECVWYILTHFIENEKITAENTSDILHKTYSFLKYYNNNYRPIYHLESIMFYIITKLE